MFDNIKYGLRLLRISQILAKHDALFLLDNVKKVPLPLKLVRSFAWRKTKGRKGERLAKALTQLGPTYIKLGQALATRSDLVGQEVAEDLSQLQDRLSPFPTEQAIKIIEDEFKCELGEVFRSFDEEPIAAASISQVHFAKTKGGNDVAVKILRPGIEKAFERDIKLLYWIAKIAQKLKPNLTRLKLKEVVASFEETVRIEMDLRLEAAAASELQENLKNDAGIKIPDVYWERTSKRVLTLERVHGIRIDHKLDLKKKGYKVDEVLQKACEMFFKQVFRDGFFHADMHPGNLFIGGNGEIIAVDFGIMGRLDKQTRIYLAEMLAGFLNRDYKKVSDVHFDAGYIPEDQSRELFAQACRSIGEPILGRPQNEISIAKLLGQLFKVSEDFKMETQPQLLLLQKTMVLAEGLGRYLNPSVNFWDMAKPLVEDWAKENMGPEAKFKEAVIEAGRAVKRVNNILAVVDNLSEIITPEGIKIHPETLVALSGKKKRGFTYRKILLFCGVALFASALYLYG